MFRALLARLGLTNDGAQLELALDGAPRAPGVPRTPSAPPREPPPREPSPREPRPRESHTPEARATDAGALLARLRAFGLRDITTLRLTRNRRTLVSYRGGTLRVQGGFVDAPDDVVRAIAAFVSGRGAARAAARRVIVSHPLGSGAVPPPPRRAALPPDDHAMAQRLQREHARLNAERFGGALRAIPVTVSRRMRTRLGHYAPARSHPEGAEIAISRRHIRRHGWREAVDTLLHEMVHQWQEENGHPIDHGPGFRRKAREVGTTPRARRVLR